MDDFTESLGQLSSWE